MTREVSDLFNCERDSVEGNAIVEAIGMNDFTGMGFSDKAAGAARQVVLSKHLVTCQLVAPTLSLGLQPPLFMSFQHAPVTKGENDCEASQSDWLTYP
jgi:hypothetical protein